MSTCGWHLPGRPEPVLGSVPEQDFDATFIAMVYQHSALLNRVARSVTRDVSEAEDVVQETFLRALRHRNKLAELRDARTWLIRITWNLALDRKRRAKVRRQTDDFEEVARFLTTGGRSAEAELITAQHRAGVLRHIDTLPAREREVFLLSAVDELSTVEIALVLKTTDSTIRSRLYRARTALKALIEQDGSLRQAGGRPNVSLNPKPPQADSRIRTAGPNQFTARTKRKEHPAVRHMTDPVCMWSPASSIPDG
jgi:RNA polymerase sigma-70 factor (ECF subfamily)